MRAFNSRALRLSAVSQVWGRTGLKTRVIISDILSALHENLYFIELARAKLHSFARVLQRGWGCVVIYIYIIHTQ